jgi:CBS domain-containing protein
VARLVDEIENAELFTLRPEERTDEALRHLITLGITGAPVVDPHGRAVGMVSLRDLVQPSARFVSDCMASPVLAVAAKTGIAEAARVMADSGHHRLAVVDARGHCTGVVSILDVLRGLLGVPVRHPPAFPHEDRETETAWTDELELTLEGIARAPEGPGVIVLIHGGAGVSEVPVWSEATRSIAARLHELLSITPDPATELGRVLAGGDLRFQAASLPDPVKRQRVARIVAERLRARRWPAIRARVAV